MIIEGLLLRSIHQLRGERTVSSIYHLLKGKKSIQTVQDAHIYSLEPYFGVHKRLDKRQFDDIVDKLSYMKYIQSLSDLQPIWKLTREGLGWLDEREPILGLDKLNGLKYHETGVLFTDRLTLLIQTLTNSRMNYFSFIPVVDNGPTESWVKGFYKKARDKEGAILQEMYEELHHLLKNFTDDEAGIFTDRLTGYKRYGMSVGQLADKYQLSIDDTYLRLTAMTHSMMDQIRNNPGAFPLMKLLLRDLEDDYGLSFSANTTYKLLKKGLDIDQIAGRRKLKVNTIYDHIVEIALQDEGFSIDSYFSHGEKEEIIQAMNKAGTHKLKEIKQLVNEKVSYFQIRLLIAREKSLERRDRQ
ncbi:helix-turn-helix domain-containing protein [Virgibacillus sediminis]|uniref:Helix-turn-helix domain-containing protein n=1 Tax=Virgibacillus sediminis TaxID=202260 RepID=A0ABV7A5G6_9BACI